MTHLSLDLPFLASQVISELGTLDFTLFILQELGDLTMIHNSGTMVSSGHGKGNVHSSVIVVACKSHVSSVFSENRCHCCINLTIVIHECTHQFIFFQHGESIKGLGTSQQVAALQSFSTSKQIIELAANPVIRDLPPPKKMWRKKKPMMSITCYILTGTNHAEVF